MNLDWDKELEEYFQPKYLKSNVKIQEGVYQIVTLEGKEVKF